MDQQIVSELRKGKYHENQDTIFALAQTIATAADKKYMDFRNTALTRLYLAGNNTMRIAAISGHEIAHVDKVLRHYIALNADDGSSAISAYENWLDEKGVLV